MGPHGVSTRIRARGTTGQRCYPWAPERPEALRRRVAGEVADGGMNAYRCGPTAASPLTADDAGGPDGSALDR
jgi:hypothetical protein